MIFLTDGRGIQGTEWPTVPTPSRSSRKAARGSRRSHRSPRPNRLNGSIGSIGANGSRRAPKRGPRLGPTVAVCLAVTAGFAATQQLPGGESEDGGESVVAASPGPRPASQEPSASPSASRTPSSPPPERERERPAPSRSASRSAEPSRSASPSARPSVRPSGPGTFTTAAGRSARAGEGRLHRYKVTVENGITVSPDQAAKAVEEVLADERGWTADGRWAFQRVSHGPHDFVVRLATPATVDRICGRYGLDTGGEVNCRVGKEVVVNLKRWRLATEFYTDDVTGYRALIINHEVGHFLGEGHMTCPGPGRPAPVMMQQIKGLKGCVPNVWPYDEEGRPVEGPAVP